MIFKAEICLYVGRVMTNGDHNVRRIVLKKSLKRGVKHQHCHEQFLSLNDVYIREKATGGKAKAILAWKYFFNKIMRA